MLAPSGLEFRTGTQRFGFALFSRRASRSPTPAWPSTRGARRRWPAKGRTWRATSRSRSSRSSRAGQTASDPDAARSIYTAQIPFGKPGRYELLGIARLGGKLVPATTPMPGVEVKKPVTRSRRRDAPAAHPHADRGGRGRRRRLDRHPAAAVIDARRRLRRRARQEARGAAVRDAPALPRAASAGRWWTWPSR